MLCWTYLARAVSEATLIWVQAVTTVTDTHQVAYHSNMERKYLQGPNTKAPQLIKKTPAYRASALVVAKKMM